MPPGGVNWWFKQDEIHQATHVHGGPEFLPWHREITNRFEALLREINPQLSLHDWDFKEDPRALPNADLVRPKFHGVAATSRESGRESRGRADWRSLASLRGSTIQPLRVRRIALPHGIDPIDVGVQLEHEGVTKGIVRADVGEVGVGPVVPMEEPA